MASTKNPRNWNRTCAICFSLIIRPCANTKTYWAFTIWFHRSCWQHCVLKHTLGKSILLKWDTNSILSSSIRNCNLSVNHRRQTGQNKKLKSIHINSYVYHGQVWSRASSGLLLLPVIWTACDLGSRLDAFVLVLQGLVYELCVLRTTIFFILSIVAVRLPVAPPLQRDAYIVAARELMTRRTLLAAFILVMYWRDTLMFKNQHDEVT